MRSENTLKSQLTKEAELRVSQSKFKIEPIKEAGLKKDLLQEAIDRLEKTKSASIQKSGMALGVGYTGLNTATVNLDWGFPDIGPKVQAIKNDIEARYGEYMKADLVGESGTKRQHPIQSGLFVVQPVDQDNTVPGESNAFKDPEKLASLVMRFVYRRRILPQHNPEYLERAENAIGSLDGYLSQIGAGEHTFEEFISELERQHISLNPYFHASNFNKEKGGNIPRSMLSDFVSNEQKRYSQGSPLPGNMNTAKFYQAHTQRMQSGGRVALTEQKAYIRKFNNSSVNDLPYDSYLIQAIANKVSQGYGLNLPMLSQSIEQDKRRYVQQLNIQDSTAIDDRYRKMESNIKKEFGQGLKEVKATGQNAPKHNWGQFSSGNEKFYRNGLQSTGEKRNTKTSLTTSELRIMLSNINVPMLSYAKSAHPDRVRKMGEEAFQAGFNKRYAHAFQKPYLNPDEFYVPGYSMTYSSNGLDDDATDKKNRMTVLPGMRKLPDGPIVYDRDNGNLGRHQLVKNWVNQDGGLSQIISTFGPWADKVLRAIPTRRPPFEKSSEAYMALHLAFNNRTNAETVFDMVNKYPTWDEYNKGHLMDSLASQLSVYHKHKDNQNSPLFQAITAYKQNGDWEALTSQMNDLGMISMQESDQTTQIDQQGFELVKKYGYQIAKLMDMMSCVMHASCREQLESRQSSHTNPANKETIKENIYGRQYATSSGKGDGGQVMIGVRYAFNTPEIVDETSEYGQGVMRMLKEEQGRRHDSYKARGVTQRNTQHPENLGEKTVDTGQGEVPIGVHQPLPGQVTTTTVMKIVENLEYFIGESGSSEGMLRDLSHGSDWNTILDEFLRRFPTLESQLGVLISPINARFDLIEVAAKKALDNVRKRLEEEFSTKIEILLQQQDGEQQILSGDTIDNETTALQQQFENDPKESMKMPELAAEVQDTSGQTLAPTGVQPVPTAPVPMAPPEPQAPVPEENTVPDNTAVLPEKPMVSRQDNPDFIGKKQKGRKLIRTRPTKGMSSMSSVLKRLEKTAAKMEELGIPDLANKLDYILSRVKK